MQHHPKIPILTAQINHALRREFLAADTHRSTGTLCSYVALRRASSRTAKLCTERAELTGDAARQLLLFPMESST